MGSIPTQTFKADLNGTGALVDITSYVADNRFTHQYGRTDWASPTQPAGTLIVTLENLDGRFTPGSTATYTRGVTRNMVVEWTCGSRVRRFYVAGSDLAFSTGVAGMSLVTLRCRDALGLLGERQMQALVRETTLAGSPVAYWPCDESPSGDAAFADISGNAQPSLLPFTVETKQPYVWAIESGYVDSGGKGPRTDGAGAPRFNTKSGVAPIEIGQTSAPLSHRGGARNNLNVGGNYTPGLNRNVTIPPRAQPYRWTGGPPAPNTVTYPTSGWLDSSGNSYDYIISMWFSIDDIYGGTYATAAPTDGPYVVLAEVTLEGGDNLGFCIMWRIPDRTIVVATPFDIQVLSSSTYSVQPGSTHHLALTVQCRENVYFGGSYVPIGSPIVGHLDGVTLNAGSLSMGAVTYPIGITLGSCVVSTPAKTGINQTTYALTGTVSNVSIHPPSEVGVGAWSRALDIWRTGTTGPAEAADARFNRIGGLAQRGLPVTLAWSPQGTDQTGLLGPHDIGGKDALTVLCETLASEEASLDTIYTGGVDTVRAWLDSTQRSLTPALTIEAQDDAAAAPELGYDPSGVAASVTAKGWGRSAVWVDTAAAAGWQGRSATVVSAMVSEADLLLLAQYRTVKGRATKISPTRIVVDAAGSVANVTTALLGLRPGSMIRATGLPSTKIGYSTIDCILVGAKETHGLGTDLFELTVIPRQAEAYVDPGLGTEGPWRLVDAPDWALGVDGVLSGSGAIGTFMGLFGSTTAGALSSGATTGYIVSNRAQGNGVYLPGILTNFMSQDAADYPLSIKVDNEIITLPNPAGAPTSTTVNAGQCWYQQVTGMLRGQQGTTAAGHSAINVASTAGDQHLTVVVPDEYLPLLAF